MYIFTHNPMAFNCLLDKSRRNVPQGKTSVSPWRTTVHHGDQVPNPSISPLIPAADKGPGSGRHLFYADIANNNEREYVVTLR